MAAIGGIEAFNPAMPEAWSSYKQRINFFLVANGVTEEKKKVATLFSVCGAAIFEVASSLGASEALEGKKYDDIMGLLDNHFSPKPSVSVHRLLFYKRDQFPGRMYLYIWQS